MARRLAGVSWGILVALLVMASASGAEVQNRGRHYLISDLRHVAIWTNLTLTFQDAALVRGEADANDDGAVDEAERVAYEDYLRAKGQESLTEPMVRVDRQDPLQQTVVSAITRGLPGPAASTSPVEYDFRYEIAFGEGANVTERRLDREAHSSDAGPLKVQAPVDFIAVRGLGIKEWTVSDHGRTVTGRSDGLTRLDFRFMHKDLAETIARGGFDGEDVEAGGGGGIEIPGLAAWTVLAALTAAAAGMGSRRPKA